VWPGTSTLLRGQGTYLDDEEIARVVDFVSTTEPDFIQEPFGIGHPLLGPEVSGEKVAVTLQAPGHVDPVGPLLERLQEKADVHLPGAGEADDADVWRVLEAHGPG